ncbi:MAG: epoxyqueuosine reductase QueH [bacterium]|nr:epoxyqueuosine reductase QueH [bacterium]
MNNQILLHACCAICAGHPINLLKSEGYEPIVYYFNPNIYPSEEYQKRYNALKTLCEHFSCKLISEEYKPEKYQELMIGYEKHKEGSERCKRCIEYRLLASAKKAKELGIEKYTTTLSSSPHKNFEIISNIGKFIAQYYELEFLNYNFKKQDGFLKTTQIAKELNLYRQNYCGCDMSIKRILQS